MVGLSAPLSALPYPEQLHMNNRQERTLASFLSVLQFLDRHPIRPEPPLLTEKRAELQEAMDRIRKLGGEQNSAKRATKGYVEHKRRRLRRDRMMPLVRIAKPILAFAPGAEAALRVPHARADALTVAAAGLRMATALERHAGLLASAGYPKTFLAEFKAESRELALVARKSEDARKRRTSLTREIAAEFKKAMKTVTVIEGLVMLHLGTNKIAVEYWRGRRRVPSRMGRPKKRAQRSR